MNAQTDDGRSKKRKAIRRRAPTIYDGDKYFDAEFTQDELYELGGRILAECGFADDREGRSWLHTQWIILGNELGRKLGTGFVGHKRVTIHMCRELEIDYKTFAKNVPKLRGGCELIVIPAWLWRPRPRLQAVVRAEVIPMRRASGC